MLKWDIMDARCSNTVMDIFSGCGGMSWGLHKAGFNTIAGIDNWGVALETFKVNHPDAAIYSADICSIDPRKIMKDIGIKSGYLDCIVGGPPCQGFSKNVPAASRFFKDPRNQLFHDYLRFVKAFLPKVVVMENVAEIYNAYGGTVRNEIASTLIKMGYEVQVKVLFAHKFGIPQKRSRCFFFASRTGVAPQLPRFDGISKPDWFITSAWEAISDLPSLRSGEGNEETDYLHKPDNEYQKLMRRHSRKIYDHVGKALKQKQIDRLSSLKPGEAYKQLPDHLRPKSGYSGAYGRLDFKIPAPTITRWVFHPGSGRYGHPKDTRILTIREVARIQSFSDDFKFCGSYTQKAGQLGNAVPPLLMYSMADEIKSCLGIQSIEKRPYLVQGALALARK